jgi:hypothetical protein
MTKVKVTDSIAGDEPELRNFAFAPGSVVMLPTTLAEKWLEHGLAEEVAADTPLFNPMNQGINRFA